VVIRITHLQIAELRKMNMSQLERADDLAVLVFWFLGDHWFGRHMNKDEEPVALRSAALRVSEDAPDSSSDPLVLLARDMADAVLELLSPLRTGDSLEKLKKASNAYEQARLWQ
jgi:hypothetical protein